MSRANDKLLLQRQLELPSTAEAIHQVEELMEEISSELEFKTDVYGNVMVAVTEAVNNSIFHGNKEDESLKIFVDCEMPNPYRLLVRVRDEGTGFDPDALPDPTAPENIGKIGGRGVFLMTQLSDKLTFSDDGRQVEMAFNV